VIEDGTVAAELLLESVTTLPDGPAALLKVTVPVEDAPLCSVLGDRLNEATAAELTVSTA